MRYGGIEPTCAICDTPLFDDPHYDDDRECLVCDEHCPTCVDLLPGDGFAPDEATSPATGDPGATRSTGVPVAGELHA